MGELPSHPMRVDAVDVLSENPRTTRAITGVAVIAMLLLGLWFLGRPPDTGLDAVTAAEPAASDSARALIVAVPRGTCASAADLDLGALAALGPWDRVCGYGFEGGDRSVQLDRPAGGDGWNLSFSADGPLGVETCSVQLEGRWWASRLRGPDAPSPCPGGTNYHPGG